MNTAPFCEASLPANVNAERSILGAIILEPKAYDEAAASGLVAGDFSVDSNRYVYSAIVALADNTRPVDLITLSEELDRRKQLEAIGDVGYLSGLIDGVPDRPSIKHYIKIVKEKSSQRKLIRCLTSESSAVYANERTAQEVIENVSDQFLQIQTGSDDSPARRVVSFSDEVYNEWESLANGSGDAIGLTTGLDCLDLVTTGIRKGELWLVGGRTGDGKTSLALQIARANCRADVPVAIVSLEMSRGSLLQRLWSQEGRVPFQQIRHPRRLDCDTRDQIKRAMCAVGQWPLFVIDDGSLTLQKLIAKARLLIRREKLALLIVDYLQLVSAPGKDERERLTKISAALRALAKDSGIPVIALSQLSRPKDGNPNTRPNKFSLKESGSLENDSHVIVLTYRPVDSDGVPTGKDELIIAKQREGPTSNERVQFNSDFLTFDETKRWALTRGARGVNKA